MPVHEGQQAGLPSGVRAEAVAYPVDVRVIAALAAAALCILWLGEWTNVDLLLADWFYDARLHAFPWRYNWFADIFIHRWLKKCIVAGGMVLMGVALIDAFKPIPRISAWLRVRLRVVAWSALLIPTTISLLKRNSVLACPWDVQRYGGDAPYLRLLDDVPPALSAGHCFPAGFASTGLWLAACGVFWLPHHPVIARRVFAVGIGYGMLLGWVQQARGAHFLTHTLWSAWIAVALLLLIVALHAGQLNRTHQ